MEPKKFVIFWNPVQLNRGRGKIFTFSLLLLFLFLVVLFYFFFLEPVIETIYYPKGLQSTFSGFRQEDIARENWKPIYLKDFTDLKKEFILNKNNFIEVNFPEMKIRIYKGGMMAKEVQISARGDVKSWGGTAAGLYKVISKSKLSFSVVAEVYMPYSIHFYGKYYIHGEPYYPGGEKRITDITGGCVQLSDKDAEEIFNLIEREMPVLVIDKESDHYQYREGKAVEPPGVSAQSFLAADLDTGFVLGEKEMSRQLPIASLTKLMTAVVVSENIDLRKSITITEGMLQAYGSTKGLERGKGFRIVELFYPLLIESSNDAAEALAAFLGKEKTLRLMNEKARSILMENTNFTDPSGFDPLNISTAVDLFQLARYVSNNRPPIWEITRGKTVQSFGPVSFNVSEFWNKNVFAFDPNLVGGKTGFIKQSEYTAIFIFQFLDGDQEIRNITIIILGSDNLETDTQKIYKWLEEEYNLSPVFED